MRRLATASLLARAACADVADHDDRNRQPVAGEKMQAVERAAQRGERPEQPACRQQDQVGRASLVPVALDFAHAASGLRSAWQR